MADLIAETSDDEIRLTFAGKRITVKAPGICVASLDFAVWTVLLYAIHKRVGISIETITAECLFNTSVLQKYMKHYRGIAPIAITAKHIVRGDSPPRHKTIMPFSGGVDSCFTLLYSTHVLHKPIHAAIHACGLDLDDPGEYELSKERSEAILTSAKCKLISVKTDLRKALGPFADWRMQSDMVLAGLLHLFENKFDSALISGGGDGGGLAIGQCFKTPFLSERLFHLFSNPFMRVDPFDGVHHQRIQKIEFISDYPVVLKHLRVCWQCRRHGNCGRCTKCVITQLAFLAAVGFIPECFPVRMTQKDLTALFGRANGRKGSNPDAEPVIVPKHLQHIATLARRKGHTDKYLRGIDDFLMAFGLVRREKR